MSASLFKLQLLSITLLGTFTSFLIILWTKITFLSSRMFDVPRKDKANLSVIFASRRVDEKLQKILGNALDDFFGWLR